MSKHSGTGVSPWTGLVAGFVAVIVAVSGTMAIFFQMAVAAGAGPDLIASWTTALLWGCGITTIGLSLLFRIPVITAWTIPGMVLLVTSLDGVTLPQTIGIFIFCGAMVALTGMTGLFEKLVSRIPLSIASAMLAGILLRFGINVFVMMQEAMIMVCLMCVVYLLGRRMAPRYATLLVLTAGVLYVWGHGDMPAQQLDLSVSVPAVIWPEFDLPVLLGIGLPMFIVTMVSQNLPGLIVLKAHGYRPRISALMTLTGLATCLLAPFGCFSVIIAAMTSAICMGKDVHPDPDKRYRAGVWCGVFYLVAGLFGTAVVGLMLSLPKALIISVAGLAIFGVIANGITTAMADEKQREPALITFLMTASGMTLFGISSAFWGLVAGVVAMVLLHRPAGAVPATPGK